MKIEKLNFRVKNANEVDINGDMFSEECVNKMITQFKKRDTKSPLLDMIKPTDEANIILQYQHSVRFRYNKIRLAINNPDNENEFKVWNEFINTIQNKDDAINLGYFYVIDDADIESVSIEL